MQVSKLLVTAVVACLPALAAAQTADVNVANPATLPAHVMAPSDNTPVVYTQQVTAFSGVGTVAAFGNIVPAGYRLIVDHVSFFGRTPVSQRFWGVFHPCDNLKGSSWGVVGIGTTSIIEDSALTNAVHFGSADTSIYVDAGCTPAVNVQRNGSSGGYSAWITLQGHLAPALFAPQPPSGQ